MNQPSTIVANKFTPKMKQNAENKNAFLNTQALPKINQDQTFRVKPRPNFTTRAPMRRKEHPPGFKPGYYNRPNRPVIKKPLFTPNIKISSPNPQIRVKTKPNFAPRRPPQILMAKQKLPIPKPENVEISPPQASTEREPETYSQKPHKPLISVVRPQKEHYDENMPLAVNTGFHPESVVIEGGFKPILSKETNRRTDDGPELKYESEIGVIDVNERNVTEGITKTRKAEKRRAAVSKNPVYVVVKRGRSDDEIAEAAENVESYYLPPTNQKPKITLQGKRPSNIDIPPGTVVTYDGKKVSGASLTVRAHDTASVLDGRASKASEYIKARPQYVPYKGELPPLDPKFLNTNVPQLQSHAVLNRELDTPDLPLPPTKLSRVHSGNIRSKRSPHHTPEHTAEQALNQTVAASNGLFLNPTTVTITILIISNIFSFWFV